jgi:putative nucleotidyltransferase with HDIG domain
MGILSASRRPNPLAIVAWPLQHIRWKIILPYAFLTLVLAGVGSYLATNVVTGSLEERFDNQLAEAARVTSDSVVRTERRHLEVVRSVAFTQGMANAVVAHDNTKVGGLAEPLAVNSAVERLLILDAEGDTLAGFALDDPEALTYRDLATSNDPASWFAVGAVLQGVEDEHGDKHAQIVETDDGFVLYTAGPIEADGRVVGVALAGTTLSTFLANTESEALASVTVYDFEGQPLDTSFVQEEGEEADIAVTDAPFLEDVISGETVRESRTVWGREYDLLYSTLQVRGETIGLYSIALPTDFIFTAGSQTRTQVAILFGVGIVAVLLIGLFLANRLTQPILRLVGTARRVSSGDLTARSGVRTADEIGALAESFDGMTARLQRQHLSTIKALTSAIDARDPYTLGHSVRVGQLAVMIGREIGLDRAMLAHLETGGYLHDIGKIGIRDHILLKPGSLTPEERRLINDHPRIGLQILEPVELPPEVIDFVASHHEWLDGTGYPAGSRGEKVSLVARIAAVSDVYDALTTDRPYRLAMTPKDAMDILHAESGRHLDSRVVAALKEILEDWEWRRRHEPELRGFSLETADKVAG